MTSTDSLEALRRSNPRRRSGYDEVLDRLAHAAFEGRRFTADPLPACTSRTRRWPRRRAAVPVGAGLLAAAAVVVAVLAVGSPVGSPAVSPAAALEQAVGATANAADDSGVVHVRMTRDGALWTARTVHWHGSDLSLTNDDPSANGRGDMLVVDGLMYGHDPEVPGRWAEMGSPDNIDPESGTTPDEYLAAVRADATGETFRRITASMADLTTSAGSGGATVYRGHVPAGDLARETGTKEGEPIRVLPYGYVAHDAAADPAAPIEIAITVTADGTVESIIATWGGAATWSFELTLADLGSAAELTAPADARPLLACRRDPSRPDC